MTRPLTAYAAGYSCGKNGPNQVNCHFSLFSSKEKTRDWERGKRDAEVEKSDRSPWFPRSVTPVRPGWYECKFEDKILMLRWGGKWINELGFVLIWPLPKAWRGLAKMP